MSVRHVAMCRFASDSITLACGCPKRLWRPHEMSGVVMHGDEIYRVGRVPDVPVAERDVIEIVTMSQGG